MNKCGFTLVELMLATVLMSVVMLITGLTFYNISHTWQTSVELADDYQAADYAMNQLVSALRSAYYPLSGKQDDKYGFMLINSGDGVDSNDMIQWNKVGSALTGNKTVAAESTHRVAVTVFNREETKNGERGLVYKVGAFDLMPTDETVKEEERDFDDEEYYPWKLVMGNVIGFNVRVADKDKPITDLGAWNWQDTWDNSNCVPRAIEITLYLKPQSYNSSQETIVRVVELPISFYSQKPKEADSDATKKEAAAAKREQQRGNRNGKGGNGGAAGQGGTGTGGKGGNAPTPPNGGAGGRPNAPQMPQRPIGGVR